jgi:protein O-GlcNAc transferase
MEQGRLAEAQESFRQALRVQPDFAVAHSNLLLSLTYDPAVDPRVCFAEHCHWGARHGYAAAVLPPPSNQRDPKRRLRIGYVRLPARTFASMRRLPSYWIRSPGADTRRLAKLFGWECRC